MAGFVVSPNTVRVLVHSSFEGRPQLNVFHAEYVLAGPLSPNISESVWTALKASLTGNGVDAAMSTQFEWTGVGCIDLRGPNFPEITSTSAALVGTNVANALSPQNAVVVTLRTGKSGRSFRGRSYVYGFCVDGMTASGGIATVAEAGALNFVNSVKAAMAGQSLTMAIRSPALPERPSKPGGTLPAKDYSIEPVSTQLVRDLIWDTNRRRLDLLRR
jgi:hypothetical protein